MFIVGIPLTQQPPGQGETSAACGMAQVLPAKREHLLCFHAGFGGSGSPFSVSWFVPLFDWLSAVRLVSFWEPNPPNLG